MALLMVLVVAMMMIAWPSSPPSVFADDFLPCIDELMPCGPYINSTTAKPPAACCKPLNQVLLNELPCACTVFSSRLLVQSLSLDVPKALTLPARCGIKFDVIAACQDLARLGSPAASPQNSFVPSPAQTNALPHVLESAGKKKVNIIPIVVPPTIFAVLIAVVLVVFFCKKTNEKQDVSNFQNASREQSFLTAESLQYEFATVQAATSSFSSAQKIGEGGFGAVYKGTLPNGQEIAVKRLSKSSIQGDTEFKNEAELLAKLQHRNLVRLLGFCLTTEEKLLVYEFVPNKSLSNFLSDPVKRGELNWPRRYNIIKGIARGMLYLHEDSRLRIIHRDLKAANVLLDADLNPKVSDFGTVRIFDIEQTQESTARIVGTYGYMAPEYAMHGQFSVKSDVYSYGVLILEVITGKKISGFFQTGLGDSLISYAWRQWSAGKPLELMDPTLRDSYIYDEIVKCIQVGLLCVQDDARKRPTMATIVHSNSDSSPSSLSIPQCPSFLHGANLNRTVAIVRSKSVSTPCSQNGATVTELSPR